MTLVINSLVNTRYRITIDGLAFGMNPRGDVSRWISVKGAAAIAQFTYLKWVVIRVYPRYHDSFFGGSRAPKTKK